MPHLRAGDWIYDQGELAPAEKESDLKAENKFGHRPIDSYNLPKWVYHPAKPMSRCLVEKRDYFGMAADGNRNYANWNVAHVAAYHDDFKLLSLATREQCMEPNKFGMTPTHMCSMGQHPYGPSIHVLYELVQMGVADPEVTNHADQTPWHVCQRMHRPLNVKKFEKILLKGMKPDDYEKRKEFQLRPRGKFARLRISPDTAEQVALLDENQDTLPVCLVFPGQGSQFVGMMKEVKELEGVKDMLFKAKGILGYDIMDLMLNGPEEKLQRTVYCQPAMYIAGLAAVEKLKQEDPEKVDKCMALAGLSLGEYTALTVAGVFDFEVALKLVKIRAEAMDNEVNREGAPKQAMLSVAGLTEETVERLCQEVARSRPGEVCQIANALFPKGFSCAGTEAAIDELKTKADAAEALQAKIIKAGGAFHTPLMAGAKSAIVTALKDVEHLMAPPRCKVYMNSTAAPIDDNTPVEEIIRLLGEQIVNPVLWQQSMERAVADGCTKFFECGPSKQLKAMMKRINPTINNQMINISV